MANSAGIKIEIEERLLIDSQKLSAVVKWLEANQPDVFRRGLWDAIAHPVQSECTECWTAKQAREAIAALEADIAQAVEPGVNQLMAQLHDEQKWTVSEQQQFAQFLKRFPNESSQGIMSLGDAWMHGKSCAAPAVNAELEYLQPADLGVLMRFQETTDDSEGYDIGKPAVKRLADLGVLQSHGFGKYSITAFGHFALESMFSQKPSLPLMTDDDRTRAAIAKATS